MRAVNREVASPGCGDAGCTLRVLTDGECKAFATAITHDGALPHLQMLQLRTQGSIFAPLGDAGANDLAVALDSRRSLPSLSALLLTEPGIDNPKLKATCEARGIDLHNGSAK